MSTDTQNSAPVSAEPVAEIVREALESAKNGLIWYRENFPEAESGADDEAEALIEHALACLAAPVAAQPDLTQQTLDDVMAGIPARDAEIEALRKEIDTLRAVQTQQPESGAEALPPFAVKVIEKLKRFEETCMDGQDSDIGKHWLDLLTQLGLLNRVQRSPAYWEITQQGEDVLSSALAQQDADKVDAQTYRALVANCSSCEVRYERKGDDANKVRGFTLNLRVGEKTRQDMQDNLRILLSEFANRCAAIDAARKEQA